MSTTPTEILETTMSTIAETVETTVVPTIAAATEAAEEGFDFSAIKEMLDGFDPAAILPELTALFSGLTGICRIAVVIGPVVILVMGLCYLFLAPKEANHYFGYRTYFGMGSINAWQYTQRLAGVVFTALGLGLAVIMVLVAGSFGSLDVMAVAWRTVKCLGWQALAVLLATLFVNLMAALKFDRKGAFRHKRR